MTITRLPLTLRRTAWSRSFTPEPAKQFVFNGRLNTTPENVLFFKEQKIEPDNGRLKIYQAGQELKSVSKEYGVSFFHSSQHVLSPFDLVYFDPRGHPLAASVRARLMEKVRHEPLWIQCTSITSPTKAIVHNLAKRRITAAVHRALIDQGYNLAPGKGPDKTVWGTIYIKINDPLKASAQPPDRLGVVVAKAIDKVWPRRVGGPRPDRPGNHH